MNKEDYKLIPMSEIMEIPFKEINLSNGMTTVVDEDDYDLLNQYEWYAWKGRYTWYAIRNCYDKHGKRTAIRMHRQILGLDDPKILCDHKNRNGLNNRKGNLRSASVAQNNYNSKSRENSTSKYIGVSKKKSLGKWVAQIQFNRKKNHLGYFETEESAARAYDNKARELFGEFANLNFK